MHFHHIWLCGFFFYFLKLQTLFSFPLYHQLQIGGFIFSPLNGKTLSFLEDGKRSFVFLSISSSSIPLLVSQLPRHALPNFHQQFELSFFEKRTKRDFIKHCCAFQKINNDFCSNLFYNGNTLASTEDTLVIYYDQVT